MKHRNFLTLGLATGINALLLTFLFISPVGAQSSGGYTFKDTLFGNVSASTYIAAFYAWAVRIAIFAASVGIIWSGYRYAMSRGNPSEVNNAKETILSILVGLTLLLLAFTILQFLGVNVADVSNS